MNQCSHNKRTSETYRKYCDSTGNLSPFLTHNTNIRLHFLQMYTIIGMKRLFFIIFFLRQKKKRKKKNKNQSTVTFR